MIIYLSYMLITLNSLISRHFFDLFFLNFQIYNKPQYKNITIFTKHIE